MRLAEVMTLVRERIGDSAGNAYTDAQIIRYINVYTLQLYREVAARDGSYHRLDHDLLAADAIQVHDNEWAYVVPPWVERIMSVRYTSSSTESRGERIPELSAKAGDHGWEFDARRRFRVVGFAEAQDLTVDVQKIPAKIFLGSLPSQTGVTGQEIVLPSQQDDTANGSVRDVGDGWYANAIIEITGADDSKRGQVRRIASSRLDSNGRNVVTPEVDWDSAPVENDTFAMHPEVPDQNVMALVTLIANTVFAQRSDLQTMQANEPERREEGRALIEHSRPRDESHWQMDPGFSEYGTRRDPDREWWK